MPLISSVGDIQANNPHYVRFKMEERGKLVTVHISTHSLRLRAASDGIRTSNAQLLFSAYREEIEAAASVKYDAGHRDGADIVITERDLPRELIASASSRIMRTASARSS